VHLARRADVREAARWTSSASRYPARVPIRILVLNQYYPPDVAATGTVVATICEALADAGAEVLAIVGQPSYLDEAHDAPDHEVFGRLTIRRIPMGRLRGRQRFVTRFLGYLRFLYGAWRATTRVQQPDVVVTFHNPPLLATLGSLLARRFNVPFVYIVQDIHPDILARTGWPGLPRWLIWVWRRVNRAAFAKAQLVITLTDVMRDHLTAAYGVPGTNIAVIPMWSQPDLGHIRPDVGAKTEARRRLRLPVQPDDLVIVHAGNMGVMHPVETLASAAALVRDLPVRFFLAGDGARRKRIEDLVRELDLRNLHLMPYQSTHNFELLVEAADICAVVLQVGLEDLCLPSRAMTFMSAGRPILAIMDKNAPISRELAQAAAGWSSATAEGVAEILRMLVGARHRLAEAGESARGLHADAYRLQPLVRRYTELIIGLASTASSQPHLPPTRTPPGS